MSYAEFKNKIKCKLIVSSIRLPISQILAGFTLLARSGVIKLSQECKNVNFVDIGKPYRSQCAAITHLRVALEGRLKLYYDMYDSGDINEQAALESDYYFKRSYDPVLIPDHLKSKVFPFGLNYSVYPHKVDLLEAKRTFCIHDDWLNKRSQIARMMRFIGIVTDHFCYVPTDKKIYSEPDSMVEPRILFMTRTWDPFDGSCRTKEMINERIRINETRAQCIKLLRKEFGSAFTGGFERTPYALKQFKGLVLENKMTAEKKNYILALKKAPIGIATTGLYNSIGWKMGEYVAFSKAIISEPLQHVIPGDFKAGRNYLEFRTPEQCVEQAARLFQNDSLRCQLMNNNHQYYLNFLKPDVLVARTLKIALANQA